MIRLRGVAGLLMIAVPVGGATAAEAPPARTPKAAPAPAPAGSALALFQRDWVLMNWALRFFDTDGDIALSPKEAAAAAAAFRKLADVDRDGRITPTEYRLARHYIMTRN
jgi:hypothetical protein